MLSLGATCPVLFLSQGCCAPLKLRTEVRTLGAGPENQGLINYVASRYFTGISGSISTPVSVSVVSISAFVSTPISGLDFKPNTAARAVTLVPKRIIKEIRRHLTKWAQIVREGVKPLKHLRAHLHELAFQTGDLL